MQMWAIIVDSFREARDRRLFWILLALSTLMAGTLACIGYDENGWSLFFGAVRMPVPPEAISLQPARVYGAIVSHVFVDVYLGWIGTLLALIATAGFFPNFMARGRIDVLLSKPMSRVGLFLAKYVGSLVFVFVQSAYFVVLTLVVLRFRMGLWIWPYLWAVPLLVALFSYLYCVTVLFSLWTRSSLAALLLTLLFWLSISGIYAADHLPAITGLRPGQPPKSLRDRSRVSQIVHITNLVLPNTSDVPILLGQAMNAANLTEIPGLIPPKSSDDPLDIDPKVAEEAEQRGVTPLRSVGGSLAFEVVVLAFACWWFARRDF